MKIYNIFFQRFSFFVCLLIKTTVYLIKDIRQKTTVYLIKDIRQKTTVYLIKDIRQKTTVYLIKDIRQKSLKIPKRVTRKKVT